MKWVSKLHKVVLITLLGTAAIIYGAISFVNHYLFRTSALDLGIYNHAIYMYSHFQMATSALYEQVPRNLLSDHFDLLVPLFSPLHFVFGSYTMLIVQIAALLIGALGVYRYFKPKDVWSALLAVLYFLSFYGLFGAISYDYHSNVVAAAILPWFFVFIRDKKLLWASLIFVLIIVAKENMALWMVFVCLGMAVEFWREKTLRVFLLLGSVFSAIYFIGIIKLVIPALAPEKEYFHFDFAVLGEDPKSALIYIFSHPIETINNLFINHIRAPSADGIKAETYLALCLAGLPILLRKPHFLLMLIPILFQKMLNDVAYKWSVDVHYNIEFAPILTIGIFSVLVKLKNQFLRWALMLLVCVLSIWSTGQILQATLVYRDDVKIQFYREAHYTTFFDYRAVHETLALIPPDASLSASFPFVSHLCSREEIYEFPICDDCDYTVFTKLFGSYPLGREHFEVYTEELVNSSDWEVLVEKEEVTLLKRRK